MEIKINKEIRSYKENVYFGQTAWCRRYLGYEMCHQKETRGCKRLAGVI